jgi:two-component system CheB/CheR fusion protein
MDSSGKSFPVVGIGASAGGLEAISELLAELPAKTGMGFLFVQHLSPRHQSFLADILSRKTTIAVETAADGTVVEPDHFYVIPPNSTLTIAGGVLRLRSREASERPHKPINRLFRSLATERGHRAVAVVLSGTGDDGARRLWSRSRLRAALPWRKNRPRPSLTVCQKARLQPVSSTLSYHRKSSPRTWFESRSINI